MERLLKKLDNGRWQCSQDGKCPTTSCDWCKTKEAIFKKCAEYEESGLMPNDVKNLVIEWQAKDLNDHITELLAAEKQGLLHKAPVPDGTKIFIIQDEELAEMFNEKYEPIGEASYYHGYTEYVFGELGTGFFLTKEAAEQALKER